MNYINGTFVCWHNMIKAWCMKITRVGDNVCVCVCYSYIKYMHAYNYKILMVFFLHQCFFTNKVLVTAAFHIEWTLRNKTENSSLQWHIIEVPPVSTELVTCICVTLPIDFSLIECSLANISTHTCKHILIDEKIIKHV